MENDKGTQGTPKKEEPRWWLPFLNALSQTGNVLLACKSAKVIRRTAYKHKGIHPSFRRRWEEAQEEAVEALEAEAWRRATKGVEEPVWHQGRQVGAVRKYSDTLLIFLLKGNAPTKYRELDEKKLAEHIADKLNGTPKPAAGLSKSNGNGKAH